MSHTCRSAGAFIFLSVPLFLSRPNPSNSAPLNMRQRGALPGAEAGIVFAAKPCYSDFTPLLKGEVVFRYFNSILVFLPLEADLSPREGIAPLFE